MLVDVANVEPRRIGDPGDRLVRHHDRRGKEPTLSADLDPAWSGRADAVSGVGKMFGSVWAAASSLAFRATSVPRCASAAFRSVLAYSGRPCTAAG